jgi:hypothetical protein
MQFNVPADTPLSDSLVVWWWLGTSDATDLPVGCHYSVVRSATGLRSRLHLSVLGAQLEEMPSSCLPDPTNVARYVRDRNQQRWRRCVGSNPLAPTSLAHLHTELATGRARCVSQTAAETAVGTHIALFRRSSPTPIHARLAASDPYRSWLLTTTCAVPVGHIRA